MDAEQHLSLAERKRIVAAHRRRTEKYADDWDMLEFPRRRSKALECLDVEVLYLALSVNEPDDDDLHSRMLRLQAALENCSSLSNDDRRALRAFRAELKEFERVSDLLDSVIDSLSPIGVPLAELERYEAETLPFVKHLLGGDVAHIVDDILYPGRSQESMPRSVDLKPVMMPDADLSAAMYRLRLLRGPATGPLGRALLAQCRLWAGDHPNPEVRRSVQQILSNHYLICGDYQRSIDALVEVTPELEYLMNLVGLVRSEPLSLETALSFFRGNSPLTDFGHQHEEDVLGVAGVLIEEHQRARGLNLIEEFCVDHGLATEVPEDHRVAGLPDFSVHPRSQGETTFVAYGLNLFPDLDNRRNDALLRIPWRTARKVESQVSELVASFLREAEEVLRESMGLPRIGEGIVAEPLLLHRLRTAFPAELIVPQAVPSWLAPQSFDIYFPNRSIAVEYQGAQHSRPLEYFGGAAGFARQQERDERKRRLCAENGCTLVEVHPHYDVSAVLEQIGDLILRSGERSER